MSIQFPRPLQKKKTCRSTNSSLGEFKIDHVAVSSKNMLELQNVKVWKEIIDDLTQIKVRFQRDRSRPKCNRIPRINTKCLKENIKVFVQDIREQDTKQGMSRFTQHTIGIIYEETYKLMMEHDTTSGMTALWKALSKPGSTTPNNSAKNGDPSVALKQLISRRGQHYRRDVGNKRCPHKENPYSSTRNLENWNDPAGLETYTDFTVYIR